MVDDLDAACKALNGYVENDELGELGELQALVDALNELPAGSFKIGTLIELIKAVSVNERLATSQEALTFLGALAQRAATLVSEGKIVALPAPAAIEALLTIVAGMGADDYPPGDPRFETLKSLIETVVLRCVTGVKNEWIAWWNKQSLLTMQERAKVVFTLCQKDWVKASGLEVPDGTDPRVVRMFAAGLAQLPAAGGHAMRALLTKLSTAKSLTETTIRNLKIVVSAMTTDHAIRDFELLGRVVVNICRLRGGADELMEAIAQRLDAFPAGTIDASVGPTVRSATLIEVLNAAWDALGASSKDMPGVKHLVGSMAATRKTSSTMAMTLLESEGDREGALYALVRMTEARKLLTIDLHGLSVSAARRVGKVFHSIHPPPPKRVVVLGEVDVIAAFRSMKPNTPL